MSMISTTKNSKVSIKPHSYSPRTHPSLWDFPNFIKSFLTESQYKNSWRVIHFLIATGHSIIGVDLEDPNNYLLPKYAQLIELHKQISVRSCWRCPFATHELIEEFFTKHDSNDEITRTFKYFIRVGCSVKPDEWSDVEASELHSPVWVHFANCPLVADIYKRSCNNCDLQGCDLTLSHLGNIHWLTHHRCDHWTKITTGFLLQ